MISSYFVACIAAIAAVTKADQPVHCKKFSKNSNILVWVRRHEELGSWLLDHGCCLSV